MLVLVAKTNGRHTPRVTGETDWAHFTSRREHTLSEAQLVTIAEAPLIRCSQFSYNKHYGGGYPMAKLRHLVDAYRLDHGSLVTEIDTEKARVTIRSATMPAADHHIARVDLHTPGRGGAFLPCPSVNATPTSFIH